jgi:predicted DNA-binding protein
MRRRTNIYLNVAQLAKLKAIAKKTGAPVSELVRRAIDAYLKKKK